MISYVMTHNMLCYMTHDILCYITHQMLCYKTRYFTLGLGLYSTCYVI